MEKTIKYHLDQILSVYSIDQHYDSLKLAKDKYCSLTNIMAGDEEDFEHNMRSFNDWYILQFSNKDGDPPAAEKYIEDNNVDDEIAKAIKGFNHSIFVYSETRFRKRKVLKDILHNQKIYLSDLSDGTPLLKNDVLIGRVINYKNNNYLMDGVCTLPKDSLKILKKQARKVRKLTTPAEETKFLLQVEALKNKWKNYNHVSAPQIFNFPAA